MIMNDNPGFSLVKSGQNLPDKPDKSQSSNEAFQESARKTFGKNMRLYMTIKKISQSEMAKLLDVDPSTISRYLSGKAFPSPEHLDKICQILGIPVSILYGESGNGRPVIREDQSFEKDSLLESIVKITATLTMNGKEKVYRYALDVADEEAAHKNDSPRH